MLYGVASSQPSWMDAAAASEFEVVDDIMVGAVVGGLLGSSDFIFVCVVRSAVRHRQLLTF